MGVQIECLSCGEPLTPNTEVCPKCGSRDRKITVSDSGEAREVVTVKRKSPKVR